MKKNVAIALILMSFMALALISEGPIWVHAQTELTPSTSLTVQPNPDGVGFPVTIAASIQPSIPAGGYGKVTFALNITPPNGTSQVLTPTEQSTDQSSDSFSYQYTPLESGNFSVTFSCSGGSFTNNTVVYLPTEKQTILTVLQNPYPSASPSLSPTPNPNSEQEFRLEGIIQVGNEPNGVVYDSGKNEIFVANENDGTVSVISDRNDAVVATVFVGTWTDNGTIAVGWNPCDLAYDSGKGEIFVANVGYDTVVVISDSTNSVVATIPVILGTAFTNPTNLAYDPAKGEIFVTDNSVGEVSVISDSTNSVIANVPVGASPNGIVYDSGKGEVFVTIEPNYPNFAGVSVISDLNNSVVANIPVGNGPENVAYDSGKGEIFVTNSGDNTTSVISDSSNTVVATLTLGADPQGLAYDSGKNEIFVANHGSNTVSVISDNNNTVIANINGTSSPQGVAYDSGKSEVFVTNYYYQFNFMSPPSISNTVLAISDYLPLATPFVSTSVLSVRQGQTISLTSNAVATGVSPYAFQWFGEDPSTLFYMSISGATAPNYNFTTLKTTATGNWTFLLEVSDATGATVNSTATTVTVNAPAQNPMSALLSSSAIILIVVVIIALSVCVGLLAHKRSSQKTN